MRFVRHDPVAPKVYNRVGYCIYCGSDGGERGLTKEHPIPLGLGGGAILPKSSCYDCAKITGKTEQINRRSNFRSIRSYFDPKYRTRRPKERPTHFPMIVGTGSGRRTESVPFKEYPFMLVMPRLREPGIFVGAPIRGLFWGYEIVNRLQLDESTDRYIEKHGPGLSISQNFNVVAFIQMLAKIAHSMAAAEIGLDKFTPLLPDLILGTNLELAGYLVGQSVHIPTMPLRGAKHEFHFRMHNDRLVASIRLFSRLGGKAYCVVTGERVAPEIIALGASAEPFPN